MGILVSQQSFEWPLSRMYIQHAAFWLIKFSHVTRLTATASSLESASDVGLSTHILRAQAAAVLLLLLLM